MNLSISSQPRNNSIESSNTETKLIFTKIVRYFLLYLPVLLILALIFFTYISYIVNYIYPLISITYTSNDDYPFKETSSYDNAFQKGACMFFFSTFFCLLLLISILRTIFMDPGYFKSPVKLEDKVILSQCIQRQYNKLKSAPISSSNSSQGQNRKNFNRVNHEKEIALNKNIHDISNSQFIELNESTDFLNNINHKCRINDIDLYDRNDRIDFLNDLNQIISTEPLTNQGQEKLKAKISLFMQDDRKKDNKSVYTDEEHSSKTNNNEVIDLNNLNERFKNLELSKAALCGTCLRLKVERTHHCRRCGKCVLKMDHHCPWLANCIGFRNYKYFILTQVHGLVALCFVLGSYWEAVICYNISKTTSLGLCFITTFSYVCGLGLFGFLIWLAIINWKLALTNQTVVEHSDKERFPSSKSENIYDLGLYKNICSVFGENPFIWLLPINANYKGHGYVFETIYDYIR